MHHRPSWNAFGIAILAALCTLITFTAHAASSGSLRPATLRCEYLVDPLAIAEPNPRLMWIVESDERAQSQSAYRVLVASTPELLAAGTGDLWDSGKVTSSATAHIAYAGAPLRSTQRCFWKVMAWDKNGTPGPWSDAAHFAMGLLSPGDWTAKWIEAGPDHADLTITRAIYHTVDTHPGER
ncbi:MAG TPA: hypothetical protein VHN77_10990, partial [Phycisphaerales bacterium]|nr:hypothetical protein [Phycisphaerales bacterium]